MHGCVRASQSAQNPCRPHCRAACECLTREPACALISNSLSAHIKLSDKAVLLEGLPKFFCNLGSKPRVTVTCLRPGVDDTAVLDTRRKIQDQQGAVIPLDPAWSPSSRAENRLVR
jgi:hypothetical protein